MEKDYTVKVSGETQEFSTGARRDKQVGKGRYDLISTFALREIARIYEEGARAYGERNYERGMPLSRFLDSAQRHISQCIEGKDDENHAAQAAWNMMGFIHIRELIARGILPKELNDLPNYTPRLPEKVKSCSLMDKYVNKKIIIDTGKIGQIYQLTDLTFPSKGLMVDVIDAEGEHFNMYFEDENALTARVIYDD